MDYTVVREITKHNQPSEWQVVKGQSGLSRKRANELLKWNRHQNPSGNYKLGRA